MGTKAHFRVDTKLAALLGENYRSTEYALKELIDNAWDADAENVWIYLPAPLTADPIIIIDDGLGMTERELTEGYLKIASDRRTRKGERTLRFNRRVKGRKGIGKFAGLVSANVMEISTRSNGKKTKISIVKADLLSSDKDLEKIDLPMSSEACPDDQHGTAIKLTDLNQNLSFPDPNVLKQILFLEYGRQANFRIFVNEEALDIEDLPGETIIEESDLNELGVVKMKFTITDKRSPKQSGIAVRVNGKIVGKPHHFGLENSDEIPTKLLSRVYGEVETDGLEDAVTADWGAIIENSKAWQKLEAFVRFRLLKALKAKHKAEIGIAQARWKLLINRELDKLPPHKRPFAATALDKVLKKFYDQKEEHVRSIIAMVFDLLKDANIRA
ncbi:MAG: ATP-binding protein [Bacteroidetes bacterium]|nr:ATP-binding protein [Bacteroidota bacterium]MBL0016516.1 ATP-binding protein [Bacteroidota bacterium]MBP6640673.1 ATP-binding protein [Bacteroidia bacterium]